MEGRKRKKRLDILRRGNQEFGDGSSGVRKRLAYEFYNGSFDVILENAADFDTDENEEDEYE